eukprot:TRINITY_DN5200_c0_g1_i4.p1 TRINITY_DN5200_c0_g1~~TRINITY_DN5200_c0_g1_i4.p1  ORF type:complete len:169 (+),score=13.50 TRINITY_DN5200_c0_g1_i4:324-830(+)
MLTLISNHIVAVVDSTIHPTSKPRNEQSRKFNGHYKAHGMMTHLLISLDGSITAVMTNIDGSMSDATAAHYNTCFKEILGNRFALGDPGYNGVPYVISGLRVNQINSSAHSKFDMVTRSEQVIVEHVNCFIKKCAVLSKQCKFIHMPELLVACVFIICGWYNKRSFEK